MIQTEMRSGFDDGGVAMGYFFASINDSKGNYTFMWFLFSLSRS